MGYYTSFELEVDKNDSDPVFYAKYWEDADSGKTFGEYELTLGDDLTDQDSMKWYGWEEDMKNLSKLYPNVLFSLFGKGEEAGDIWKAWFRNGKAYAFRPDVAIPKPANLDTLIPKLDYTQLREFKLTAEKESLERRLEEVKKELAAEW